MVHALERARKHLVDNGALLLIQPHQWKRPFITVTSARKRQPVAALVNPAFQPFIDSAVAAIQTVIDKDRFRLMGTSHHQFRVRLASPAELHRYLHLGQRPPRFPAGGRQRFEALWRRRPAGARIEVTEFLTVFALRAVRGNGRSRAGTR
jgi:hypothetical protein